MALDERRIQSIVSEVLGRLEAERAPDSGRPGAEPLGVHADLDAAIAAAFAGVQGVRRHAARDA
jgi:hypothetical protein